MDLPRNPRGRCPLVPGWREVEPDPQPKGFQNTRVILRDLGQTTLHPEQQGCERAGQQQQGRRSEI